MKLSVPSRSVLLRPSCRCNAANGLARKIADSNSDLATLKPVILTFSDSLKLVYLPTKAIQVSGHAYVLGILILPLFLL